MSAVERAARAYVQRLHGRAYTDDEWAATRSQTEVDAMRAALAAAAPTVEEVAEVLCECDVACDQCIAKAEYVVALWGAL